MLMECGRDRPHRAIHRLFSSDRLLRGAPDTKRHPAHSPSQSLQPSGYFAEFQEKDQLSRYLRWTMVVSTEHPNFERHFELTEGAFSKVARPVTLLVPAPRLLKLLSRFLVARQILA